MSGPCAAHGEPPGAGRRVAPVRVGLLSTARVTGALLHAAAGTDAAEVVAVASRDRARAERFASAFGVARCHGDYDALLADPEVDVVYVALPNALHAEWAQRALEAGKHVLCEKPLARRTTDVEAAFAAAERADRVLMEGFMFRHHPQTERLAALVAEGAIGRPALVRASFSFTVFGSSDVRLRADLDGGALMDLGCYCVSAARLLAAAEPERAHGVRVLGGDGVDVRFAGTLAFPDGILAQLDVALDLPDRHGLEVMGDQASLRVADPWHCWRPGIELRRGVGSESIEVPAADPHRLQLENLCAAVRGEAPPLLGRDDAVAQARALEELHRSAEGEGAAVAP